MIGKVKTGSGSYKSGLQTIYSFYYAIPISETPIIINKIPIHLKNVIFSFKNLIENSETHT